MYGCDMLGTLHHSIISSGLLVLSFDTVPAALGQQLFYLVSQRQSFDKANSTTHQYLCNISDSRVIQSTTYTVPQVIIQSTIGFGTIRIIIGSI